jgi:periplasmic protein TonB
MAESLYTAAELQAAAKHQSAESMISIALLSVCAAAGLAAWGLAYFGKEEVRFENISAAYESRVDAGDLAAAEDAVLAEWRERLNRDLSRREQAAQQQKQSAVMQEQAAALAAAQAAAEAANRAAADAEARARSAEQERIRALATARDDTRPAKVPAPSVAPVAPTKRTPVTGVVVPASVDWNSCDKPVYPLASVRLRQQGVVVMAFDVSDVGEVLDSRIVESSGTRRLDSTALKALERCRFSPETVDGSPRASSAQVRFAWRLD